MTQDFTSQESAKDEESCNIIDIRSDHNEVSLKESLLESLRNTDGTPELPDLLLWDEAGLKAFEAITYSEDYYLTNEEISVLEKHADSIAQCIEPGTMLIELGSGNLRKVKILLDALDRQAKSIEYYALDLSRPELYRTLSQIPPDTFKHVRCFGLLGTYDDGQAWLRKDPTVRDRPQCILSLGSTIGSFTRQGAAQFIKGFVDSIAKRPAEGEGNAGQDGQTMQKAPRDFMLIAVDGCKDAEKVWRAYNSPPNTEFISGALRHANTILGYDAFKKDEWAVKGEWNEENGSHDQYYVPLADVDVEGTRFRKDVKVLAVRSHKYDEKDRKSLWRDAGVEEFRQWGTKDGEYGVYLIAKPAREVAKQARK